MITNLKRLIRDEYRVHWTLDLLPAAYDPKTNRRHESGFPFGKTEESEAKSEKHEYLHNHHDRNFIRYLTNEYQINQEWSQRVKQLLLILN